MKEIQIITWCDSPHDSPQPAQTHQIALDTSIAELDLCDECWAALEWARKTLANAGHRPERKRSKREDPRPGSLPCPECSRTFTTAQGVSMHRVRMHGYRKPKTS